MPRQRSAARVLGPYPKRDKWRLVVRDERGAESFVSYATKEEAERVKLALTGELRQRQPRTIAEAVQAYELYLRDVKQNKPTSVRTTIIRLHTFFPDDEVTLAEITPRRAASMHLILTRAQSVDSQRNILSEARTFLNQVPQNLQATFQRQSQAYRDYLVSQVAGGYMRPEVAIEALQEREANHQRDLRDQEATRQYEQQQQQQIETRAHQSANQALYEQRERIIEQKAKADNLHPEIVRDIYARAGQELEEYANAALYGYAKTQQEYEIGVAAIRGYQALVEAQKTGSQLAVKQAMNSLRILAEQRYSHHLQTRRSRATAQAKPANPAPGAPQLPAQMAPAQPRSGYQLPNGQNLTEALFS